MISCLCLRPKWQQMAFLARNQSANNKPYGIWTMSSLAQTAGFNCLGDCVLLPRQSQLDIHCVLQGCPHLSILVCPFKHSSLFQKGGLQKYLQQIPELTPTRFHYSALLLEEW